MATIDWAVVHRSTKPANKRVAERALEELYRLRGLKRPDVIWVASPAEGVEICRDPKTPPAITSAHPRLTSSFLHSYFRLDYEALADPFWIPPRRADSLANRVPRLMDELSPTAPRGVAVGIGRLLRRALGTQLVPGGNFDRPWTSRVRSAAAGMQAMQLGQFDGLLAAAGHVRQHRGREALSAPSWTSTDLQIVERNIDLAASAGPWWARRGLAIVCERPMVAAFDDRGRLHATDGPALRYRDGFAVWAIAGVSLPARIVSDPESITVGDIRGEPNQEVRRSMIELFGPRRYVRARGASLVDRDRFGTLWRWTEEIQSRWGLMPQTDSAVEVVNSTPEPDGTRRRYFLWVPPTVRTAREAVAWTFGLTAEEYAPRSQS